MPAGAKGQRKLDGVRLDDKDIAASATQYRAMQRTPRRRRARPPMTWQRLHAFFPEGEWKAMAAALERLQRAQLLHRDVRLTFRTGPRKGSWRASP